MRISCDRYVGFLVVAYDHARQEEVTRMAGRYSPSARRRRLSALLRKMREERGLTIDEVSRRLDWPSGKLSRMERNEWKRPSPRDMQDLAEVYELSPEMREAVINLARESRVRGWWVEYRDVLRGGLADFEAGASMIRTYEALLIPGLLQTPDYAAAVMRSGRVMDGDDITRKVAGRMRRQQVLEGDDPLYLWALIDEAALRKQVGGREVMTAQIQRLIDMAARPNVDIQVVRDSFGAHAAIDGSFMILDFQDPADPPMVYLETATDDLYLEDPKVVQRYVGIFGHTCSAAETPQRSVAYLKNLIA